MLIKKWLLIFLYIGLMDWGSRHLTITVETGGGGGRAGHLPTKIVRWAGHLTNSNVLEAGFDSHITTKHKITHYN